MPEGIYFLHPIRSADDDAGMPERSSVGGGVGIKKSRSVVAVRRVREDESL